MCLQVKEEQGNARDTLYICPFRIDYIAKVGVFVAILTIFKNCKFGCTDQNKGEFCWERRLLIHFFVVSTFLWDISEEKEGNFWWNKDSFYKFKMANSQAARPGGASNNAGAGGRLAQFKLVLLGESAVGKSSLVLRFVKGQFHEFQVS